MGIQLNFKCNESWEKMTTTNSGRFCGNCSKNVFDLTDKSDTEIDQLFIENKGNLCGRIKSTQLNNPVVNSYKYVLAKFCVALFFAFGSLLFSYELNAQNTNSVQVNDTLKIDKNAKRFIVKGQVTDVDTKEPIFGVSVILRQDSLVLGVLTDFDGNYELILQKNKINSNPIEIEFINLEYQTKIYNKLDFKSNLIVNQELKRESSKPHEVIMILGGIGSTYQPINSDPNSHRSTTFKSVDIKRSPY